MNKLCLSCNTMFFTPYPDQLYCNDTCQRREKGRRRKERRLAQRAHVQQYVADERYHATIANPTDQQMTEICVDTAEGKFKKPILVIGILPKDYLKPNNVEVIEQPKEVNQPPQWIVVKKEPSIVDIIQSLSPK